MVYLVSWKEQQKVIEDAQQYVLNPDLSISVNPYKFAKKESNVKYDSIVLCPFCLTSDRLDKFVLRKGLRVCPCCGSQLKLSTLTGINDINKFVEFVFNYRFNGFWGKICLDKPVKETRFPTWNQRLRNLGLSLEFWEKYKAMKGDFGYGEDIE